MGDKANNIDFDLSKANITSYQIEAFKEFVARKDFLNARVLEIGGHDLPPDLKFGLLGARKWHSIDIAAHGSGDYQTYQPFGDDDPGMVPLDAVRREHLDLRSLFIGGDVVDVSNIFENQYDIVISICAFEHINKFPLAIDKAFRCLSINGSMLSYFGPIWSSFCGHHFYHNANLNFNKLGPIDHHDHLLLSQPEMYEKLIDRGLGSFEAASVVDQIYCSKTVNRLFFEDYVKYLEKSRFTGFSHKAYGTRPIAASVKLTLEGRYPGYKRFDAYGLFLNAWKTGARA